VGRKVVVQSLTGVPSTLSGGCRRDVSAAAFISGTDFYRTVCLPGELTPRSVLFERPTLHNRRPWARICARDDAYGVPIAQEIERTGGRTVAIAAVYAALDRFATRRLVTSSIGDPTPERGDPQRSTSRSRARAFGLCARPTRD
jgi:hypothetical protein